MPKSQFDDQLTVSDGLVQVSGSIDPDTTARAKKSGADIDVHWVLAQGDLVAHGQAKGKRTEPSRRGTRAAASPGQAGPAQVSGVTVTVALSPRPAQIDAIQWHQEVRAQGHLSALPALNRNGTGAIPPPLTLRSS